MMLKLFAALNLRHFFTCLICSLMLISVGVAAHEYETQAFVMEHPFANPSQPGQTLVPVYLRFLKINDNDRLISAECRYANSVELRGSQDLNSPPISAINISVGDNFEITPNTPHILLKEISIPFNYLSHYDLKLHFEKSGMIEVTVSVGM